MTRCAKCGAQVHVSGPCKVCANGPKTAERLRQLADKMQAEIDYKRTPTSQNLTRRRIQQEQSKRRDANRLELVQRGLRVLADAHEQPERWPGLLAVYPQVHSVTTRKGVEDLYRKGATYIRTENDGTAVYTPGVLEQLVGGAIERPGDRLRRMEEELVGVKIQGFFPTPRPLGTRVAELAYIQPGYRVLDPSAGKGDLLEAVMEAADIIGKRFSVDACERNFSLRAILKAKGLTLTDGSDCTSLRGEVYDRIVMNPPFENGQDVEHVRHCFEHLLKPGGRLVAIVSEAVFFRTDRKYEEFRDWMDGKLACDPEKVSGAFSGAQSFRQTAVTTRIIVLDKPACLHNEMVENDTPGEGAWRCADCGYVYAQAPATAPVTSSSRDAVLQHFAAEK